MSKTFIHSEEISKQTYKGDVFLLIYLSYDVVLARHVLQHKMSDVKWRHDVP